MTVLKIRPLLTWSGTAVPSMQYHVLLRNLHTLASLQRSGCDFSVLAFLCSFLAMPQWTENFSPCSLQASLYVIAASVSFPDTFRGDPSSSGKVILEQKTLWNGAAVWMHQATPNNRMFVKASALKLEVPFIVVTEFHSNIFQAVVQVGNIFCTVLH